MDIDFISELMLESMRISTLICLPLLGSGMIVGLIISILQATTSIQEQTLTFVPKMIAIVAAIIIFGPWIVDTMIYFTEQVFDMIPDMAARLP